MKTETILAIIKFVSNLFICASLIAIILLLAAHITWMA